MSYKKVILAFFLFYSGICSGQITNHNSFLGDWKIKKWIFINVDGNHNDKGTMSNMNEYAGQEHDSLKYVNHKVRIDSSGIYIEGNKRTIVYAFDSCYQNFLKFPIKQNEQEIKIIRDNKYTYNSFGQELDNDSIVGRQFVRLLDRNYDKPYLTTINTSCRVNGHQIKICFLSSNKIAIYRWMDVIVLQR